MNKFVILVGSRNNGYWVESHISSILSQDYSNYKVIYFDDNSDDNTKQKYEEFVKNNPKFTYINSDVRKYKTWFFNNLNQYISINDSDILVFLDGDDMFYCENVLSYLDSIYNQNQCWMTYGGMIVWDGDKNVSQPYPQNSEIPNEVIKNRSYRKDLWRTSHLKTMRGAIWNKINKSDLIYDGKYIVGPDDLAIMFSALEICPSNKVYRVTEPIYLYNHSDKNQKSRAFTDHCNTKIDYENIVRRINPYNQIPFVTPTLAGGLGNQMFEIAAAASLAKDNNTLLVVNNEEHCLPNQGRNVNTYRNNIFSKILFDSTLVSENILVKGTPDFSPIPYQPNQKLHGHYQSYKYFENNKKYIRELFINKDIINELKDKYFQIDNSTAIQIRRGDYYKFPNHHPQLPISYFQKAVEYVKPSWKIYIFSDDINWCKSNLNLNCNVEYIQDEDYNELYLISMCKNIIISNSSFGWWAAYLHQNPNANIIVPSIWFGKLIIEKGFIYDELIPKNWTII